VPTGQLLEERAAEHDVAQGVGPDVAARPVADPVPRHEPAARRRPAAGLAIAEAQMGLAVIVHLDDEIAGEPAAVEQVVLRFPDRIPQYDLLNSGRFARDFVV